MLTGEVAEAGLSQLQGHLFPSDHFQVGERFGVVFPEEPAAETVGERP